MFKNLFKLAAPLAVAATASTATVFAAEAEKKKKKQKVILTNPGPYSKFDYIAQDTLGVNTFAGGKISVNKNTQFQDATLPPEPNPKKQLGLTATLNIGNPQIEGGNLSEFNVNSKLGNAVMYGSADGSGRSMGVAVVPIGKKNTTCKTTFQLGGRENVFNIEFDLPYESSNVHFGLEQGGVVSLVSVSQAITPDLAVGAQLIHLLGMKTFLDGGLKYKLNGDEDKVTESIAANYYQSRGDQLALSYYRMTNDLTVFSSDLTINSKLETRARVGMSHMHRQFQYKAAIDSDANVQATMDVMANEFFTLHFSSEINQISRDATFGLGLSINM